MRLFVKWIVLISQAIANTSVMIMGIIVCYEVILRYFLNRPTIWVGEISSYLLIWLSMTAVIVSLEKDKHIKVDLVFVHFPHRVQTILNIFTSLVMMAFCGIMIWQGSRYFLEAYQMGWKHYGNLYIPMSYTRSAVPVGGVFIFILLILKTYDYILNLRKKDL